MIRNRLQSLLHKHNLLLPEEGLLHERWWQRQENISVLEKMQIRQELVLLKEVDKLKVAVDEALERQSTGPTWGKQALQLMQLPGVGFVVAMTVLAAIGDISRFENAKQLVGYAGLGAGVHTCTGVRCQCDSGKTHKEKKITKIRKAGITLGNGGSRLAGGAAKRVALLEGRIRKPGPPVPLRR